MVVYYIKKEGESLADYRYPIKEGDICMLYDGEVIKTVYIDSELDPNSIWRDFKFIDTKSLKSYQFPTSNSILCAPIGDKQAIGDTGLLTQLIKECKGEWLLDFLNETSAVLSGFVDYWDLGILSRFIGDDDLDVVYENEDSLTEFLEKPDENKEVDEYDDEEDVDDSGLLPKSDDVKWFCLSALACLEGRIDKRSYQILFDTLNGASRSEIASKFDLTQERIRQIIVKATKEAKEQLIEQRKNIEETKVENAQLNAQLKLLQEEIVRLKALLPKEPISCLENENEELSTELALLLETPIEEIYLPVRAANILICMGIKKFADIPQIKSEKPLLNMRNSGRKTVHDITKFLKDFNLSFGMSYTEIVNALNSIYWHTAKRDWIRSSENKETIVKQKENEDDSKEKRTYNVSNGLTDKTPAQEDKRIGYVIRLFPSQLKGEIIRVRKDSKGIKKLIVQTKDRVVEINDLPYLYEVIKKKPHSETKINSDNKESTVEYVAKPTESSYQPSGSKTYKDVAFNSDDCSKMKAILEAMTHFYAPATPLDIARTISRSAWGGDVIREDSVDSILKRLPEVEYVKWGKYILKNRNRNDE